MNKISPAWRPALFALLVSTTLALAADRIITATEATGTYRDGKSEIKLLSTGPGTLKVDMKIVQPLDDGSASGEATIKGDVATFVPPDTEGCAITMTFLADGSLKVESNARPVDCGFGRKAPPDGTYRKVSSAKPKFASP